MFTTALHYVICIVHYTGKGGGGGVDIIIGAARIKQDRQTGVTP